MVTCYELSAEQRSCPCCGTERNDVDPQLYLTQLLINLPTTSATELPAWLPDQWKLTHSSARSRCDPTVQPSLAPSVADRSTAHRNMILGQYASCTQWIHIRATRIFGRNLNGF
jgi:hypothetical protein